MSLQKDILLESGTNELEIIEFELNHQKFGINVIKVKEIILPLPLTPIPHAHPNIDGIIQLRGEVLPVISLSRALNMEADKSPESLNEKFIVAEFNLQRVVFRVDHVVQIHRISWENIEKPSGVYAGQHSQVIGVVKMEKDIVLLLDFEKILVDINPEAGIHINQIKKLGKRERSEKKIVVAEDSPMLRKLISDTLSEAGYENVEFFEDGKEALGYLQSISLEAGKVEERVQLVITDIEMPQMDGHHLTKRIKEDPSLAILPVVIFSSLITDDLLHKGELVGAKAQVSKPQISELVTCIDRYIL